MQNFSDTTVARGAITLWLDEAVVAGWGAAGGKGWRYSDMAILCALSLRAVFRLTLRQTQGFLHDLTRRLGLEITVPHYSTFSRRAATLVVPKPAQAARSDGGGPLHPAVDATGLKVHGEGEWKVRVHGKDKVRIMGSKSRLLQTLVAGSGVNSVPTQGLKWRAGDEETENYTYAIALQNDT